MHRWHLVPAVGVLTLALVLSASAQDLPPGGGIAVVSPPSRSDIKGLAHLWNGRYDGGGVSTVQSNSIANTWPTSDDDTTSVRAALCGTPAFSELTFSTPEDLVAQYVPGQRVTFTLKKDASSPQGHVEFRVCRRATGLLQSCLNQALLPRASVAGDTTPYDPANPSRFFLPPGAGTHTVTYTLPTSLVCSNCVVQWHFVAADTCNPPGYGTYGSFSSSYMFDPAREACGATYPQEFWGCFDVSILPPKQTAESIARVCNNYGDPECHVNIGYYQSWQTSRPEPFNYPPSSINVRQYTHVIYSVAHISEAFEVQPTAPEDIVPNTGSYALFHKYARASNPAIKTLLSIGGVTFNLNGATKTIFSNMVSTSENRLHFIASLLPFLREHDFDGVDVDWRYPGNINTGGSSLDKNNFAEFLQDLREAIDAEVREPGQKKLIFTVVVPSNRNLIADGYDASPLALYPDYLNLISYDFHGSWDLKTDFHTALFSEDGANIMEAVAYWINVGVPRNKLAVGMATYARGWALLNSNNHGVGASTGGPSRQIPYSREEGLASYFEISQYIRNGGYAQVFDNKTSSVYAYNTVNWFSYDNEDSLEIKVDFVRSMNLGGISVVSIDQDDIRKGYPLATTIHTGLGIPEAPASRTLTESTDDTSLIVTIVAATCGVVAFIVLIIYCLSRSKNETTKDFGKYEYKDTGAGVEYDTPIPIIAPREVDHDEFRVGDDNRMQGRVVDDDDQRDLEFARLQRRLNTLTRGSNTEPQLEMNLDDEGRMVARHVDRDDFYVDPLSHYMKPQNRSLQLEVERNDEGRFVARHYDDDLETELLQAKKNLERRKKKQRNNLLTN